MEPFQLAERGQAVSLLLPSWSSQFPALQAGFSTRIGGMSKTPYASLNCGLHVGDEESDVCSNRRLVAEQAGFAYEAWTCAEQVHGSRVHVVHAAEKGRGRMDRDDALPDADALVTNVPGIMLASLYADCVPLYFVHPDSRTIALAHAGWKGTALQIAAEALRVMQEQFFCVPEDIYAVIGPSIGSCCYEVDRDVALKLAEAIDAREDIGRTEHVPGELGHALQLQANGRYVADLKEINRQIMIKAGIQPSRIEISRYCTSCRTDLFFSHRKEKGKTGRMASWIGWKEEVED